MISSSNQTLHHGLHRDGKVLTADLLGATEYAGALGLIGVIDDTTVRANRTFRPQDAFQHRACGFVILKMRFGK